MPLAAAEAADWAALWPRPSPALALMVTVTVVEPMHVLSLRHVAGAGTAALAAALTAEPTADRLPGLPQPGQCCGAEPRLVWCRPDETLLLTQDRALAAALLAALHPAPGRLACALDLSPGNLVLQLRGAQVEALLSRLVDAQALPREAGQASRMRLADIAAVVWRDAPDAAGLLVDRAHGHYLAHWLSYAAGAIGDTAR
ncbi:MAG: hypothetical protein LCI02_21495 [Proteobacteria bacterium]|nr:hypothetical protein [Pseudomonadota bacterium]